MAELQLTKTRIQAGVWEGVLTGTEARPEIEVSHMARPIAGVSLREDPDLPGQFLVRVPIPIELLSEGVQTFVITDKATEERLESFTIVTGQPVEEDFRAEMELLREELDMLKRAFRRHCVETM
ncbi:hypothetical protein [Sinisalibacter aestuarii]|uniref:Uncharacterized protein n=1 Tax=Sinisalibacter aestuarii TaxID=2949426 RepID=A0ABQ5LWL0_9RHOB|nr:hypothetical protein [Sinisalibacter aestuarii]GKY88780.1 hypothetical protein STA1M1_26490 [Sinisalibacter aestuarii]